MLIHRWQAREVPTPELIKAIFDLEGLESKTELQESGVKIAEHRHPYTEVRFVAEGELQLNIAGNQLLMRAGDRIEIPANTKHSHINNSNKTCVSIVAHKLF